MFFLFSHWSQIYFRFGFSDGTSLGRSKYICRPNFDEISQSTAEILLLLVSKNKLPPYWNCTSSFDFHLFSSSASHSTLCLKKGPTCKLSVLCQILTDFQNFCTAGKRIKFATKQIQNYPPHLRYVATLPWEIRNSNFLQIFSRYGRKCKQMAF